MSKKQMNLKDAQALGHMSSLPEVAEIETVEKETDGILSNPEAFRMAVGRAQMDGLDYVEVTDDLFKFLVKNQPTGYLTYGDPGIKVFRAGTRLQILKEEAMNAEDHASMISKRRVQALESKT